MPTLPLTPPSGHRRSAGYEQATRGILLILAAVFMFSILNVLIKILTARYPVTEVLFFRNLTALVPAALMVSASGGITVLKTRRLSGHLGRSLIGLLTMVLLFWAIALLPLADATALWFSGPLFLTALSVPLLGEPVGIHRWSAVVVGFAGILIMVRPGDGVVELGALVALSAAVCYALAMIGVRRLSTTENPVTTVFYFTLLGTLLSAATLPFAWVPSTWPDLGLLVLCGLVAGTAQYCLTAAYSAAPVSVIGPFNYSALIWAALWGYLVWGDLPSESTLWGAPLVVASGLYIWYRETRPRPAKR